MGLMWIVGAVVGWAITGFIVSRVFTIPSIQKSISQIDTRKSKYAAYYANGMPM